MRSNPRIRKFSVLNGCMCATNMAVLTSINGMNNPEFNEYSEMKMQLRMCHRIARWCPRIRLKKQNILFLCSLPF
jgi:hypothetical protein